ncbi:MAG: nickel ABC transporter permease [Nitrospinota bacterium]
MTSYIFKRTATLVPTVLGVLTAVFFILQMIPGDPVEIMLGEAAVATEKEALRQSLGLDRPILERYTLFMKGLFTGDLGHSIHTQEPVLKEIVARWPKTLILAASAILFSILFSIPLGILSAYKKDSLFDNLTLLVSLLGIAIPNFWLGPLLIILFSIQLGLLPVSGSEGATSLILPAITLGTAMSAVLVRLTRSSLLEVLNEEYIKTARAKGLPASSIYVRHALPNALLPVLTVLGLQMGALLAGAVITETIFSWPGIGRLLITAIERRDYPLVQGTVLAIALGYVFINFAVDILYAFIDPRIKLDR